MGLFDRLFGWEKKEEETVLRFSDLRAFLRSLEKKDGFYGKAKPVLEEITYLAEGIKEDISFIDSAGDLEDTPKRLVSILKTSKPAFIKAMLDSIDGLDKVPSEKDVLEYQRKLGDFLDSAPKIILGQGRYLHFSHGEKLGEIKKDLKFLLEKKRELDELHREGTYREIGADIKSLEDSISKKQALETDEKALKRTIGEKEAVEKGLRERIENIEETDSFRAYAGNKKILVETVKERERLENGLYNLLTPIKKTLKAINHNLEKDHSQSISRKELAAYAENPVEEFMSQDITVTKQFFSGIKSILVKEALGLDENRIKKTISIIDEILSPKTDKTKEMLAQLIDEEKLLSAQINQSPYLDEKANLGRDIEKTERELHLSQDEHRKMANLINQTNKEITSHKKKLEDSISKIKGEKVLLDL